MDKSILTNRKKQLEDRLKELAESHKGIIGEMEKLKANYNATEGALLLVNELMSMPEDAPPPSS